ncbi:putative aaa family atpase protein [Neofusicoccum parvum UCRNP2]|uniref:Putative aaa family atpase protein n=1 Tax=Botryosphaeria parva (strain UCR-NP2) TaxID=1287680 RepID=R1GFP5_BOTPV|nr:putative aaa family atpase protein [Neofusicoccum parvum UCRNP2]
MHEKTWTNLLVQNITPVEWNKQAFESLAVDKETKELITALVTNKVAADEATDVISGKGSGLIVLLHGSPGTGKTLTAESVAELPERPLYRVTCGDIGTTAEDVEKYIKSVLDLGKTWNCVVLLDEAEVFLQERSLQDLQRNALVSVFLRVLEYYDGILILTSNRVGTFDEAFKSRIQLSLHYEPLNEAQRRKIWENFFERLETFESKEDDVDIGNLRSSLGKLAKYKLNGRQIRNVITTARQLARHKGKPVNFEALKHVIKVSTKFDDYLKGINENLDDEELAREDRLR